MVVSQPPPPLRAENRGRMETVKSGAIWEERNVWRWITARLKEWGIRKGETEGLRRSAQTGSTQGCYGPMFEVSPGQIDSALWFSSNQRWLESSFNFCTKSAFPSFSSKWNSAHMTVNDSPIDITHLQSVFKQWEEAREPKKSTHSRRFRLPTDHCDILSVGITLCLSCHAQSALIGHMAHFSVGQPLLVKSVQIQIKAV